MVEGPTLVRTPQEQAPAVATARQPRARRWPLVVLWLLTLTGIAAAVTGYLGIDMPGLPAHLPPFWRSLLQWL